jgi:hypothetical protein
LKPSDHGSLCPIFGNLEVGESFGTSAAIKQLTLEV